MLQAYFVLQKLKTAHRKLFQISPYCYFMLTQRDIKFPPSESSTRATRWPGLLWQRSKGCNFWVWMKSIYIDGVAMSLLTVLSNIRTGQKRNLYVCINLLANWGLEWSKWFKNCSATAAFISFCLLYWIRWSKSNRIQRRNDLFAMRRFLRF